MTGMPPRINVKRLAGLAKLEELADILQSSSYRYEQQYFRSACGTPSCALGHWVAAHPKEWGYNYIGMPHRLDHHRASLLNSNWEGLGVCEEFGITDKEANDLFSSVGCGAAGNNVRKAVAYIRAFVERERALCCA